MTREQLMQKEETKRFLHYVRIRYGADVDVVPEILAVLDAHDAKYPQGTNWSTVGGLTQVAPGDEPAEKVPFSFENVIAGHWEFYHDDSCGAVLDPYTKRCAACGWVTDMQSMGARRVSK